jgi:Zn finger protein HypA/HybF involved in hydrogenase expression
VRRYLGQVEQRHVTTATAVRCECGHETTVFPHAVQRWADEVPERLAGDASVAIADEDGLFTCAGCARRVYVPIASMN